jgi:hypothetical protein
MMYIVRHTSQPIGYQENNSQPIGNKENMYLKSGFEDLFYRMLLNMFNPHSRSDENAKALGIHRSELQKPAATKRDS